MEFKIETTFYSMIFDLFPHTLLLKYDLFEVQIAQLFSCQSPREKN